MKLIQTIYYFSICIFFTQTLNAICLTEKQSLDPGHISFEEYKHIENCLHSISSEDLPPMRTNRCVFFFKNVKFVGDTLSEEPIFEVVYLNNNPNDKRNCIVLYVTYNAPYPENVSKIVSALQQIGFDGHVIYRIGGYPNLTNGSLKLIDVPYAFKACAMQEAYLLGYQNILWLDSSLTPVKNLRSLFDTIETEGYFAMTSGSTVMKELNSGCFNLQVLSAMHFSTRDSYRAAHITTPAFGLNLHSDRGRKILQRFYQMAEERSAFFCEYVDEAPISAILYHLRLKPSGVWHQYVVKDWEWDGKTTGHYFSMSRGRPMGRE